MGIFTKGTIKNKLVTDFSGKAGEYDKYIIEHQKNVLKAWYEFNTHIMDVMEELSVEDMEKVFSNIKYHDESKYSAEEFEPYRNWFYPVDGEEKNKLAYDRAWLHHQANNPHHWQYWVNINDDGSMEAIEMDEIYLAELICDWIGMSYKFHNNPYDFYNERKDGIILAPLTRKKLETLLEMIKDKKF